MRLQAVSSGRGRQSGSYRKGVRLVVWICLGASKARSMAKPAPVTVPTEPSGSILWPVDLVERIAKSDSEDPSLDVPHEDVIRETIERLKPQALRWLPTAKRGSTMISAR